MSESATPESGALSVDQAIASLVTPPPEEQTSAEAPVEAAEAAETPNTEGETSAPEETAEGAETPAADAEADAEQPEAVAPVEPPRYWSQDAKAKFAELPADLQAVVLAQEGPREEAAAKAKAQAAEQVAAAQKDREGVQALATHLADFLPKAIETFQQRWGEPDWAAVAQEHGADNAFVLKAQYEAEQKQIAQLAQANQTAQVEAQKATVQAEWKTLAEIYPELAPDPADPAKGADKRQDVVKYLRGDGYTDDVISQISAKDMRIAHKAMLWDQAQAALKAAPKPPKPAAPTARTPVRPAAAQAQSPTQRSAAQVANRFAQTRSVDDAVALLLARKA